jgi:radical SAM protein with 4Fe4S-binding SPASM domain
LKKQVKSSKGKKLALSESAFLKRLEFPAVYKKDTDELYELGEEAFDFLENINQEDVSKLSGEKKEFVDHALKEGILSFTSEKKVSEKKIGVNEIPSLRYLLLNITKRCNLKCKHCYLGEEEDQDLPTDLIFKIFDEFEEMGGLRLIVSGGEPLLHPDFWKINDSLKKRAFRSILNSNGILIDEEAAGRFFFDEVQISLDGMKDGHEALRGKGTFKKAIAAIEASIKAGKDVSVATMIHSKNINEFNEMEKLLKELGVIAWIIDVPVAEGRLRENLQFYPPLRGYLKDILEKQFGSEVHESSGNYICGAHLASVQVNGSLTKCGFYEEWSGGSVKNGLRKAWKKLPKMKLNELSCECPVLEECRGGCRYRAEVYSGGDRKAKDPVKCLSYGMKF